MACKMEALVSKIGVRVEKRLPLSLEVRVVGAQGQNREEPSPEIEFKKSLVSSSKRETDSSPGGTRAAIASRVHDGDRDIEEQHQASQSLQQQVDPWGEVPKMYGRRPTKNMGRRTPASL